MTGRQRRIGDAFGWRCAYCGSRVSFDGRKPSERAAIDHVLAPKHGGKSGVHNEVLACFSCNSSKRDRPLLDWLESASCRVPRWRSFAHVLTPKVAP